MLSGELRWRSAGSAAGEFGDGQILAYAPVTDAFLGTLNGKGDTPIDNFFSGHCSFARAERT